MNPCETFSHNGGKNPFSYLFQKVIGRDVITPEEKAIAHKVKMAADQKSAKARQNRKRNKV